MADVTIYTKPGCPYCAAAKQHYSEEGIPFDEISVRDNLSAQEKVLDLAGGKQVVPVIIDHGKVLIGFGGS